MALLGVLSAIAGILLVRHPILGVVAIAFLVGIWLITFGIVRFMEALSITDGHRSWSLAVAALEMVAGIVIVAVPGIGVATLAVLVGIAFILRGAAVCALGWALHGLQRS